MNKIDTGIAELLAKQPSDSAENSFWAVLRAAVFSFRSAFRVSMFAVIEVISDVRQTIDSWSGFDDVEVRYIGWDGVEDED